MGVSTWGLSWRHSVIFQNPASELPDNKYITEDASDPYITEDGTDVYVPET